MRYFVVLAFVSLSVAAKVVPDDTCAPSLEWLTCAADVVVVGQVKKLERKIERMPISDHHFDECTLLVKDVIRGDIRPGQPLVFAFNGGQVDSYVKKEMQSKAGILVFLYKTNEGNLRPVPCETYPIVGLTAPGPYTIDRKFRVVKDGKEVLDICRDVAKKWSDHVKKNPDALRNLRGESVPIPPGTAAYARLIRGGNCDLLVPKFLGK
jgi:hypothetical protein